MNSASVQISLPEQHSIPEASQMKTVRIIRSGNRKGNCTARTDPEQNTFWHVLRPWQKEASKVTSRVDLVFYLLFYYFLKEKECLIISSQANSGSAKCQISSWDATSLCLGLCARRLYGQAKTSDCSLNEFPLVPLDIDWKRRLLLEPSGCLKKSIPPHARSLMSVTPASRETRRSGRNLTLLDPGSKALSLVWADTQSKRKGRKENNETERGPEIFFFLSFFPPVRHKRHQHRIRC